MLACTIYNPADVLPLQSRDEILVQFSISSNPRQPFLDSRVLAFAGYAAWRGCSLDPTLIRYSTWGGLEHADLKATGARDEHIHVNIERG
nr:hypothetical protein CFP56_70676 [Quercus suber]